MEAKGERLWALAASTVVMLSGVAISHWIMVGRMDERAKALEARVAKIEQKLGDGHEGVFVRNVEIARLLEESRRERSELYQRVRVLEVRR